jgi:hypothetical protein
VLAGAAVWAAAGAKPGSSSSTAQASSSDTPRLRWLVIRRVLLTCVLLLCSPIAAWCRPARVHNHHATTACNAALPQLQGQRSQGCRGEVMVE